MYDIALIGAGPRAMAVAIQALDKNLSIVMLDKEKPGASWSSAHVDPNMIMRSPLSFDLVSNTPQKCSSYALHQFAGYALGRHFTKSPEEDLSYVTAQLFYDYLQNVFEQLQQKGITYQEIEVTNLDYNKQDKFFTISTKQKEEVRARYVIAATGYFTQENQKRKPAWLGTAEALDVYSYWKSNKPRNKKILIMGASQPSVEVAKDLVKLNNYVYLTSSRNPKGARYPAPDQQAWKDKSVFKEHYNNLETAQDKLQYLAAVNAWQPSIFEKDLLFISQCPNIKLMPEIKGFKLLNENPIIFEELGTIDQVYYSLGHDYDFNKDEYLKFLNLPRNKYLPHLPDLNDQFKSPDIPLYFTGRSALWIGGPAQESVISAGPTARIIVNDITRSL